MNYTNEFTSHDHISQIKQEINELIHQIDELKNQLEEFDCEICHTMKLDPDWTPSCFYCERFMCNECIVFNGYDQYEECCEECRTKEKLTND